MAPSLLSISPATCVAPRSLASPRRLLTFNSATTNASPLSPGLGRGALALGGAARSMIARISATSAVEDRAIETVNSGTERPVVVIDNYDSFTYNLCQYLGELGVKFDVYKNDEITVEDIKRLNPRGILVSPGPGTPQDAGISLHTILELGPFVPVFGVCMGLQCIGEAFGGKIVRSPFGVMHGKTSLVYYDETQVDSLFHGLPNPFTAGRYHSLVIEKDSFPSDVLELAAWTEDGLIMAARHKKDKHIQGVQFRPESILTPEGKTIVGNFIKLMDKMEQKSMICSKVRAEV